MRKFGGWLAGILAGIIVSYAAWYFTRPPSVTTFEGMVYSASSPVPKAMVSLQVTGSGVNSGSFHEFTDQNGSYLINFTGLPKSARVTLSVVAAGFQDSQPVTHSNLGPDNRQDFPLTPLVATASPSNGTTQTETPAQHIPPRIPLYVRKAAAQVIQVRP